MSQSTTNTELIDYATSLEENILYYVIKFGSAETDLNITLSPPNENISYKSYLNLSRPFIKIISTNIADNSKSTIELPLLDLAYAIQSDTDMSSSFLTAIQAVYGTIVVVVE